MKDFWHKIRLHNQWIIVIAAGLMIRLIAINSRPIWYDEAFSLLLAEQNLTAMLSGLISDVHPPLYYLTLWGWMKIFPAGVPAARLLSIFMGGASLFLVIQIAYELMGSRGAVTAALLAGFSSFQVHYAQEIRMYSLLSLWLFAATFYLIKAIREKQNHHWALFALASAAAQYTHNLACFYLIFLVILPLLLGNKRDFGAALLSSLGALILYLPWLYWLGRQLLGVMNSYWIKPPTLTTLFTTLLAFFVNLPVSDYILPAALFSAFFFPALGIWPMINTIKRDGATFTISFSLALLSFGPFLAAFLFSQWVPIYIVRAFLASGAVFLIWLAWVFWETDLPGVLRAASILGLFLMMGLGLLQHYRYRGFPYAPYRSLASYLEGTINSNDRIVHSNKLTMLPIYYHAQALPQYFVADPEGGGTDTLSERTQQVIGVEERENIAEAVGNASRVWWIVFAREIEEYQELGLKEHPQLSWLQEDFLLVNKESWGELEVYHFR